MRGGFSFTWARKLFRGALPALAGGMLALAGFAVHAKTPPAVTVYQDPNCACCHGWAEHMRAEGFQVREIHTSDMSRVKAGMGVPVALASCHTAVIDATGQLVEGHVPANAVRKMLADPGVRGVAAPGMPANSPGMGPMDGNLVTVDFDGRPFSRD